VSSQEQSPALRHQRGVARARLQALRRLGTRLKSGQFRLEGVGPFLQACGAGIELDSILWSPRLLRSSLAQKLVRHQRRAGVPTFKVSPEDFRGLSCTARASGVAAVARQRWSPLAQIDPGAGLCWLAIERIRSPGNLGTILRTAEACGAAGLLILDARAGAANAPEAITDPYAPDVVQASRGALFHLQTVRTTRTAFLAWARQHEVQLLASSPKAPTDYTQAPLRRPRVLLIGEERRGLSDSLLAAGEPLRIPILGVGDSLNVGVATGVLLYELLRRSASAPAGPDRVELRPPVG
jgi:RNA methyltransferase, TrmH family